MASQFIKMLWVLSFKGKFETKKKAQKNGNNIEDKITTNRVKFYSSSQ